MALDFFAAAAEEAEAAGEEGQLLPPASGREDASAGCVERHRKWVVGATILGCVAALAVLLAAPVAQQKGSKAGEGLQLWDLLQPPPLLGGPGAVSKEQTTAAPVTRAAVAAPVGVCSAPHAPPCLGALEVRGAGKMWLIQAGEDTPGKTSAAATVKDCSSVTVPMTGRAYFGARCTPEAPPFYDRKLYANLMLVGKSLSYTVDLSGVGCGCVAQLSLVGMAHNTEPGKCGGDFYCDVAKVCGVACAQYNLMEASKHAFHTNAHSKTDQDGLSSGVGGEDKGLNQKDYRPGGTCVDTDRPFQVQVYFAPSDSIVTTVSQVRSGGRCQRTFGVRYPGLASRLARGMTPVLSYWSSLYMGWFDGSAKGAPPICAVADPAKCGARVTFRDFALGAPPVPPPTLPPPPPPPPPPPAEQP